MCIYRSRSRLPKFVIFATWCFSLVVSGFSVSDDGRQLQKSVSCDSLLRFGKTPPSVRQNISQLEDEHGDLKVNWTAKVSLSDCELSSFRKRIWSSLHDGVEMKNLKVMYSVSNVPTSASSEEKLLSSLKEVCKCDTREKCSCYNEEGSCSTGVKSCGTINFPLTETVKANGRLLVMVTYEVKNLACLNSQAKAEVSMAWTSSWGPWRVAKSIYRLCTFHPSAPETDDCEPEVLTVRPRSCIGERDSRGRTKMGTCGQKFEVGGRLFSPFFEWQTVSSGILAFCDLKQEESAPDMEDEVQDLGVDQGTPATVSISIAAFGSSVVFAGLVCVLAHKAPVKVRRQYSRDPVTIEMKGKLGKLSFADDSSESTVASYKDSSKHRLRLNGGASPSRGSPAIAIGSDLEDGCNSTLLSSSSSLQDTFEDSFQLKNSISSDHVDIEVNPHDHTSDLWAAQEEGGIETLYASLSPSRNSHGPTMSLQVPPKGDMLRLPSIASAKKKMARPTGATKVRSQSSNWDVISEGSIKSPNKTHRPSAENAAIAANALRDIQNAPLPPIPFASKRAPAQSKSIVAPSKACESASIDDAVPRNDWHETNWDAMSDAPAIDVAKSSKDSHFGSSSLTLPTEVLAARSDSRKSNWDAMSDVGLTDEPSGVINQGRNFFECSNHQHLSSSPSLPIEIAVARDMAKFSGEVQPALPAELAVARDMARMSAGVQPALPIELAVAQDMAKFSSEVQAQIEGDGKDSASALLYL